MSETERKIIEALSQVVSPQAAQNLLRRALGGRASGSLQPHDWVELLHGPLQHELSAILPLKGLPPSLQSLAQQLAAQASSVAIALEPTLEATDSREYVDLQKASERQALVLGLARSEGVLAVVLECVGGKEYLLGGHGNDLPRLLSTVHRLLDHRGRYRVFYTVFREAQLVLRPLERGYLAVLTRDEANLGQLLYRMSRIEAIPNGAEQ
ncbi:hypothetical protein [Meiothermus rufus]|uniref:hypothetical protein n=1 Tax=Meiothermus rufus TaxID=604332 RepID=UPI000482F783|nr:hypothetical protein [Meiothermus rufus]